VRCGGRAGFTLVKLKVGARLEDDIRRCGIPRDVVGETVGIALDANQVWDVPDAIPWVRARAGARPEWIEEPTSPDDILGTAAIRRAVRPIRVATGEHVSNRVIFKQLLQWRDRHHADRRVPGGRVNRTSPTCCWPRNSGFRCARIASGVGLCELVSISRCSTTPRSRDDGRRVIGGSITCTSISPVSPGGNGRYAVPAPRVPRRSSGWSRSPIRLPGRARLAVSHPLA
jgi:hypothetical protein